MIVKFTKRKNNQQQKKHRWNRLSLILCGEVGGNLSEKVNILGVDKKYELFKSFGNDYN